jgi:hypothetical protein
MQPTTTTSIHKVRRDAFGGKRGDGHLRLGRRIVRPDPQRIQAADGDASLTGCGGLVASARSCVSRGSTKGLRDASRASKRASGRLSDGRAEAVALLAHLQTWRASWIRRVLLCVPGRLCAAAANAIELHPVLGICFGQGCDPLQGY